ncbi:YebC/PmpR family DNA-binding transcriptional regulator [Candidatus Uabimicrobium sp. HlEnr_7]|uniref:YebC/PmpR family DNA-binding transcriptional regulator n=1 Tax=Candidatus Uabimicrobium helgolandensis TaxID=3095367 RepID=UPI003556B67E
MAGHSHWAGIKHKKGAADKKRGKLFSKLAKAIIISVKDGGGSTDLSSNLKLRYAVDRAKENNMPKNNIERAIKKGAGVSSGDTIFTEIMYEGYGPGGVAIMVEVITDNRNRSAFEVRKLFENNGGKLGESGCVAYMFDKKGVISVEEKNLSEDELMEMALEAGADDIISEDDSYEIITDPGNLGSVKEELEAKKINIVLAEVTTVPSNKITLDESNALKVLNIITDLEGYDDADNVYANFEIPDDILDKISSESQ